MLMILFIITNFSKFRYSSVPHTLTNWKRPDNRSHSRDDGFGWLRLNCWCSILKKLCQAVLVCLLKALQKYWEGQTPAGL